MRLFFRHVAPHFIGESGLRSRSRKQGTSDANGSQLHQSELKTISSKPTRSRSGHIDDDDISLGSDERAEAEWRNDASSETGMVTPHVLGKIVKTETTVISSEVEPQGQGGMRESWKARF